MDCQSSNNPGFISIHMYANIKQKSVHLFLKCSFIFHMFEKWKSDRVLLGLIKANDSCNGIDCFALCFCDIVLGIILYILLCLKIPKIP